MGTLVKEMNVTSQLWGLIERKANGINVDDTDTSVFQMKEGESLKLQKVKGPGERLQNEKYHMMSSPSGS